MVNRQCAVMLIVSMFIVVALLTGCNGDNNGPDGPTYVEGLFAINGLYYRGEMGESTLDPLLYFAVRDASRALLPDQQVHLDLMDGDGSQSWRSVVTDSTGKALVTYTFSGDLGHAVIRGFSNDGDTVNVILRANTLIPGGHGQGQYILYDDDNYADVISLNGPPLSIDMYPEYNHDIIYLNYEDSFGVVIMLADSAMNYHVYDTTSIHGIIVNTIYEKKTPEGIGVGSPIDSLRKAYGDPERIHLIDNDILVEYNALGLNFYCDSDTTVVEIHMFHPRVPVESAERYQGLSLSSQETSPQSEYRLHQD